MPAKTFAELQAAEVRAARKAHPQGSRSLHEAYAVLLEEVDELWDQVRVRQSKRDRKNIREEFVHIAAMAQRGAEDLGYVRRDK